MRHADSEGKAWAREAQDDMVDTYRERDLHEWKFNEVDPCDGDVWRSNARSAMRVARQLPGGEPTNVDDAPAPAHLSK